MPVINCRVCQSLINLDGKLHQHVVKCTVCNEATVSRPRPPIQPLPPPVGKLRPGGHIWPGGPFFAVSFHRRVLFLT